MDFNSIIGLWKWNIGSFCWGKRPSLCKHIFCFLFTQYQSESLATNWGWANIWCESSCFYCKCVQSYAKTWVQTLL